MSVQGPETAEKRGIMMLTSRNMSVFIFYISYNNGNRIRAFSLDGLSA